MNMHDKFFESHTFLGQSILALHEKMPYKKPQKLCRQGTYRPQGACLSDPAYFSVHSCQPRYWGDSPLKEIN